MLARTKMLVFYIFLCPAFLCSFAFLGFAPHCISVNPEQSLPSLEKQELPSIIISDTSLRTSNYVDDIATIRKNGKFGIITKSGWTIVPPNKDIAFFSNGKKRSLIGTIDVESPGWPAHTSLCDGGFPGSYIICDSLGNIIAPSILTYSTLIPQNDSNYIYYVTYNKNSTPLKCKQCRECYGTVGVMNYAGKIIVPTGQYDMIWKYSEALATVRDTSLNYGFVDTTGTNSIPCIYEAAGAFSNGLATVLKKGKWGYINSKGELVIPFEFDEAHPFKDDKALVVKGQLKYYINKKGVRI
jgi:WG containing repeat